MARLTDFSEASGSTTWTRSGTCPTSARRRSCPVRRCVNAAWRSSRRRACTCAATGRSISGPADYRVIPGDTPAADLLMSHVSVNFDRSGFQEDINVVFPIDRLRELKADGVIGSVSDFHYSFMGAAPIRALEPKARELAALLKKDRVDAVLLDPCLTELHVRRGRTGPLHRARGRSDRSDQPDPRADRRDQAAARAVGAVHARAALRRAERAGFPAQGTARRCCRCSSAPPARCWRIFPKTRRRRTAQESGFACPVSFAAPAGAKGGLARKRCAAEIAQLAPWYDLAQATARAHDGRACSARRWRKRRATSRPISTARREPPPVAGLVGRHRGEARLRRRQGVLLRGGGRAAGQSRAEGHRGWFWRETAAAQAFLAIRQICLKSDDESLKPLGKLSLIPRFVTDG